MPASTVAHRHRAALHHQSGAFRLLAESEEPSLLRGKRARRAVRVVRLPPGALWVWAYGGATAQATALATPQGRRQNARPRSPHDARQSADSALAIRAATGHAAR